MRKCVRQRGDVHVAQTGTLNAPDALEVPPAPLLSGRTKWTLVSLSLTAAGLGFFAAWFALASLPEITPLNAVLAILFLLCAVGGAGVAFMGIVRGEGPTALLALVVSLIAAVAVSPFLFLMVLVFALSD